MEAADIQKVSTQDPLTKSQVSTLFELQFPEFLGGDVTGELTETFVIGCSEVRGRPVRMFWILNT